MHRVLIVEDEGIVALDLQMLLERLGYDVAGAAATGTEAIQQAEALRPDIILMDVRLQGPTDGIEAARRIALSLSAPVIFLTAFNDPATRARLDALAPCGCLSKPFNQELLEAALAAAEERIQASSTQRDPVAAGRQS